MPKPWQTYIDDVLSGERLAGRLERLAVERFIRLCDDDRYYFDQEEAEFIISLVSCFRHTKGKAAGKLWMWTPWQYFFFAYIFGLKRKDTGFRLTRTVLLLTAKKSGKSEVLGALGVIMTFFDGENTAECYSVANTYDQAKHCWLAGKRIAEQLARENDYVASNLSVSFAQNNRSVKNNDTVSFFNPLPATPEKLDGVYPHYSASDEIHAAENNDTAENLESGSVGRDQPLLIYGTTRGYNLYGPLRQLEDRFIPILEGKWEDDTVFPLLFTLDEGDDWEDEGVWPKSNPSLGYSFGMDDLRQLYKNAITKGGTAIVNFKTKNLNIWSNSAKVWIPDNVWMEGSTSYAWDDLKGRICFGGLDLASTRDIAAFSMLFPPKEEGERYKHLTRYYCPEDSIRERSRKDRVPYEQWVSDGWLIPTPGNIIDYDFIKEDIYKAAADFDLKMIYYDKFNGSKVLPELIEGGLECEPFRQTAAYFNAPLKEMERQAIGGLLNQGKDPIMRWMAGNVVIAMDSNGNIKFNKEKCREKIDGMVALGMGYGAYLSYKEEEGSIYEERGIIFF